MVYRVGILKAGTAEVAHRGNYSQQYWNIRIPLKGSREMQYPAGTCTDLKIFFLASLCVFSAISAVQDLKIVL
jgi:hypothetical protein